MHKIGKSFGVKHCAAIQSILTILRSQSIDQDSFALKINYSSTRFMLRFACPHVLGEPKVQNFSFKIFFPKMFLIKLLFTFRSTALNLYFDTGNLKSIIERMNRTNNMEDHFYNENEPRHGRKSFRSTALYIIANSRMLKSTKDRRKQEQGDSIL